MKSSPASVVGILDRLSTGVSRVSIRHGHTTTKRKQPRPELTGFKQGLGEQIWVHHHIAQGMIIYTHEPELPRDSHKGLSQIPFTVKKQKPAVLRRDYWEPLCLIEVPKGLGVVGRNVMQKLREFRSRHELEWGWQAEELASKSRRARGHLIHNQRSNAVADIAAVLAGAGRGNRMWSYKALQEDAEAEDAEAAAAPAPEEEEVKSEPLGAAAPENIDETPAAAESDKPASPAKSKSRRKPKAAAAKPAKALVEAKIYWSNDLDRNWAREWSENVTHSTGLPEHITNPRFKTANLLEEQPVEAGEAETEHVQGTGVGAQQEKSDGKKGWFGWLGGKNGSPSQETRL
ncbi:hypothetical protein Daus18300_006857 [Diaporthe australafricana]|uniref:Large ribosomal subunit protein mL67 n=1 Tax=Diaporthe australafricana TaxID=127596 RepID=A0ABR3WR95_9PEZI